MSMTAAQICEHAGAALGMAGAWFVSGGGRRASLGWGAWLVSNVLLASMAWKLQLWSLLAMQCYFTFTSVRGFRRSLRDVTEGRAPSAPNCSK